MTELRGRWEVVSVECEGKVFRKGELVNWKSDRVSEIVTDWTVEGERLRAAKADETTAHWRGRITLDGARDPKHITLHQEEADDNLTYRGIYAVEGGTLRVCINTTPNDVCRPEEFVTKKGSPVLIATYKKVPRQRK